jgi:hypothetical protein
MKFSKSRRALGAIKGKTVRRDLEDLIKSIEKSAGKDAHKAAIQTNFLMGVVLRLDCIGSGAARLALVNALFEDASKNDIPHQWERKEGFECGPLNDCGKVNPNLTCFRDTSGGICASL